jgi:hypothetical protein
MLTVEMEANQDLRSLKSKRVLPWLVHGAHRAGTGDCYPALAALVNQVQNIFPTFFILYTYSPHS